MPDQPEHKPLRFGLNQFVFQYTNRCNYQCEHCGPRSGGRQPVENMGREFALSLMPAVRECGFSEVTFTGGECLLFKRDTLELIQTARRLGLKTKLISNGSWGQEKATAVETLQCLKESGLDVLNLSFDKYRPAFGGDIGQILHIVSENQAMGAPVRIQVYAMDPCGNDEAARIVQDLSEFISSEDLFLQPMLPVGRAKQLSGSHFLTMPRQTIDMPCHQVFVPYLDHLRRLFRCCTGHELEKDSPLFLGDVDGPKELGRLLVGLQSDRLHMAIATLGPTAVFASSFEKKGDVSSLCDFCLGEMGKPDAYDRVKEYCDRNGPLIESVFKDVEHSLPPRTPL